jgi:hypothetical protein
MTVVVPSPTSSSCVRLSSIMLFAAGWETSISRRIAWPSFVSTIPPIGSRSIFNIALGPRHDRIISATLREDSHVSMRPHQSFERLPPAMLTSSRQLCWKAVLFFPFAFPRSGCLPCQSQHSSSSKDLGRRTVRGPGTGVKRVLITTTGACILAAYCSQVVSSRV